MPCTKIPFHYDFPAPQRIGGMRHITYHNAPNAQIIVNYLLNTVACSLSDGG